MDWSSGTVRIALRFMADPAGTAAGLHGNCFGIGHERSGATARRETKV